jgi:hypothetical protein
MKRFDAGDAVDERCTAQYACLFVDAGSPSLGVASLTRSGATVTVLTRTAHGYTTGDYVRLAGAVPSGYNGVHQVTVADALTLTLSAPSTSLDTPAAGQITLQRVVPLNAVTAIAATLRDVASDSIINSRDAQAVKNAAGGVMTADGHFTLTLDADDNVIVGTPTTEDTYEGGWKRAGTGLQEHELTLAVTYNRPGGGIGTLNHVVRFFVQNLAVID